MSPDGEGGTIPMGGETLITQRESPPLTVNKTTEVHFAAL